MKASWIRKTGDDKLAGENSKKLLVFFGGFACDDGLMKILRLPRGCDILMLCDYRNLDCDINLELLPEKYARIGLVAWSFGLGVAEAFPKLLAAAKIKVALCASVKPIDEECGISRTLFEKTLQNLDEVGLAKFFRRVCGNKDMFKPSKKTRASDEYKEELLFLGKLFEGKFYDPKNWTCAIGAMEDKIFVPKNMRAAWGEKLVLLNGAHFDVRLFEVAMSLASRSPSAFEKNADSYEKNAAVQKIVCENLERIFFDCFKLESSGKNYHILAPKNSECDFVKIEKVLEIGCGTGLLTRRFYPHLNNAEWLLNDASVLLAAQAAKYCDNVCIDCGDAGKMDLKSGRDLILSSSCFQWIENVDEFYAKLAKALNNGGILAFSSFAKKNFKQIKAVSGRGLNYLGMEEIRERLIACGFEVLYAQQECITLKFKSPIDALRHIKATGVNSDFKSFWTKKELSDFSQKYTTLFGDVNGEVPLDYNPIYFVARKKGTKSDG